LTLNPSDLSDISALAPVELIAEGFREPTEIVVDQTGAIFVSDRKNGEILKITGNEVRSVVTHLNRPVGLSFDSKGRLLIVEEKGGSLLRLETDNRLTIVAQGMKKPRWVTVAENGAIYISAKGLRSAGDRDDDDEDEEGGESILRLTPRGQLSIFADGFKGLQGLEVHENTLFAAAKGLKKEDDHEHKHGGIFRVPILTDGSAGPITRLTRTEIEKPVGLVLDALGAFYVSAHEIELPGRDAKDAVGKVATDGSVTRFASKLEKPRGLALDSFGNLYLADDRGDKKGRILRFRAPPLPTLITPSFTNQSPLTVQGTTEPNSRIDAFLNSSVTPAIFTQDGAFALILDLLPNQQNSLAVFTTAHDGQGLTGAPAQAAIVHDGLPPGAAFSEPSAGSFVRQTVSVQAQANDGGSGIASFSTSLDGQPLASSLSPQLPASELPPIDWTGFDLK